MSALISREQEDGIVASKVDPRVTRESIEAKIASVNYHVFNDVLTLCLITMRNGFVLHGVSAPASPANYDKAVGERYAYDDAFRRLWPLEGYLLREKLATEALG